MRSKLTWIAACALALGLIAAGCGGDDGNDDSTEGTGTGGTETLTKAEFIAQADAICKESNKQIEKAGKEIGESSSAAEVDAFAADTVAPAIQSQLDGIEALGAPTGDEAQITAILDAAQADITRSSIRANGLCPSAVIESTWLTFGRPARG